jgi:poly(hydroxyalkanoate) depolymerase family esterase
MNEDFAAAMRRAASLTRKGDVAGATALIQYTLARSKAAGAPAAGAPDSAPTPAQRPQLRLVGPTADTVDSLADPASASVPKAADLAFATSTSRRSALERPRRPLGEVLTELRDGRLTWTKGLQSGARVGQLRPSQPPPVPDGARFLARSFTCAAGKRAFKLYVPASAADTPRGLVVMLHGCTQNPDDFATGTNMNAVCEAHGLLAAYPAQTNAANASSCWNWFSPADQIRDAGEPAIIAGITRSLMAEFELERNQVFVAGLSAGGAMAAVMGETYPDLYAAVGVHSGLAYGCASDVASAFAAMRGAGHASKPRRRADGDDLVRTIVFQGRADQTVTASNADRIVDAARSRLAGSAPMSESGASNGGRSYTRSVIADNSGTALIEWWLIEGAGHAWAGGQPNGSFTDPRGPDASAEMMRFFLAE